MLNKYWEKQAMLDYISLIKFLIYECVAKREDSQSKLVPALMHSVNVAELARIIRNAVYIF